MSLELFGKSYAIIEVSSHDAYGRGWFVLQDEASGNRFRISSGDTEDAMLVRCINYIAGPEGDEPDDFFFGEDIPDDIPRNEYGVDYAKMTDEQREYCDNMQLDFAEDLLGQFIEDNPELLQFIGEQLGELQPPLTEEEVHDIDLLAHFPVQFHGESMWKEVLEWFDGNTRSGLDERGCEEDANITDVLGNWCVAYASKYSLNFEEKFVLYYTDGHIIEPYSDYDSREEAVQAMFREQLQAAVTEK